MKSIIKVLCVVLALSFSFSAYAQKAPKAFVGSIKFSVTYTDLDPQYQAQVPNEVVYYFSKDGKFKTDMITPMYTMGNIVNPDGSVVVLIDAMGQKIGCKFPKEYLDAQKEEGEDNKEEEPKINETDETKVIAGYTCKKYEVIDAEGNVSDFFTTEDILLPETYEKQGAKNLKGFPMEFTVTAQGMTMTYTAKVVKKGGVNNSMFVISDDYTEMSPDDFSKAFGGGL